MRARVLAIGVSLWWSLSLGSGGAVAGLFGVGFPLEGPVAPGPTPSSSPTPSSTSAPAPGGAAGLVSGKPAPVRPEPRVARAEPLEPLEPTVPPVPAGELHALVAPAVVALVVSGGKAPARVATGVLVTASGLVLTSRHAVADAISGGASIAMVRGGPHGRIGPRQIAEAVSTRLIGLADDLDLALVEALPTTSIFYPHLPIARRSAAPGTQVLAVGHLARAGLWAGAITSLGEAGAGATGSVARWQRAITASVDAEALAPGTPLVDAVGRIVALVTSGDGSARRAIDADGLLRFALAVDAPSVRFAGVPPFRRAPPSVVRTVPARGAAPLATVSPRAADSPVTGGLVPAQALDPAMPGVAKKGNLDQRYPTEAAARPLPLEKVGPKRPARGPTEVSFSDVEHAVTVGVAALEHQGAPAMVKVDASDAPDRGPMTAPITIVELGDYHAPQTRDAEAAVRALTDGPEARARLFWKDADRGDGATYLIAARAAQAAREQDAFWSMHDRLMSGAPTVTAKNVRNLARGLGLDAAAFDTVFDSDGVMTVLDAEVDKAARLPVLATPSFIVNGRVVDGGSIASTALRAAVDDELTIVSAKVDKHAVAVAEAAVARRQRPITPGRSLAGSNFDAARIAQAVVESVRGRSGRSRRAAPQ